MEQALASTQSKVLSYEVSLLEPPYFDFYWPHIAKELDRVPHIWADRWTKDFLYEAVIAKRMQVWAVGPKEAFNLVVFTQIAMYPVGNSLQLLLAIGNSLTECLPVLDATLEQFAKLQHCTSAEVFDCRGGWGPMLKDYGFTRHSVVLSKPIVNQGVH